MSALALRGGNVWDGIAASASQTTIVLDEGKVAALGADSGAAESIDVSGCTAIPGLIEGHAHLCFNARTDWRAVYDTDTPGKMLLRMAANGRKMLEAGITTVRDLGAPTDLAIELRDAYRTGLTLGPNLLVAGAPITTTGGHCWFMGGEADGEVEIRKGVRSRSKAGVDCIKIMASGGNMTPRTNLHAPQFAVDELRACIEEAHRLELKVAAHCHGVEGIRSAVTAGVDVLEHCSFQTRTGYAAEQPLIDEIARKGIIVSPTSSIGYRRWADDGRKEQRKTVVEAIFAAGCKVAMSTDCGIPGVPHEALAGGMDVLRELAGISPIDTLKLATSRSAELLELPDRGVLAAGERADVLVVDGDPTTDLMALERVRMVIKGGEVVFRR